MGIIKALSHFLAASPRPPTPLRSHRPLRRTTKDPPAHPPRRTRHPLHLPAIPRLPRRPLNRYGHLRANFAFLKQEFPHAAESASFAERHVFGDPRASCFHARHALERLLKRVYKVEKALKPPKVTNLDGYISDPAFRELVPKVVWQKAEYIRQAGNVAVHGNRSPAHRKRRWMLCGSCITSSTGRAAPTCARARSVCRARPSTNPSSRTVELGHHPSQRPGAGGPEGPAGCGDGGPQGDRERTGSGA